MVLCEISSKPFPHRSVSGEPVVWPHTDLLTNANISGVSQHNPGDQTKYPLRPRRVTWIKTEISGVKNGRCDALKLGNQAWIELQVQ